MTRTETNSIDLELQILEFAPSDLEVIPRSERALFLLCGHIANELSVLSKLHYWCSSSVQSEGVVGQAAIMQASFVARIIASKLFEAWRAIDKAYFRTKLSQCYDELLSEEGRRALKACKKYFSANNRLFHTRNNFGFHYSPDEAHSGLESVSREEVLRLCLAEHRGNNLYYASEVVFGTALGRVLGNSDLSAGIQGFLGDVVHVSDEMQTFLDQCIATILFRYFGDPESVLRTITVPDTPSIASVQVPYFTRTEDA
ncbi:MAG TPA: hypothetical protein VEL28_02000 [Candidatus Binatia bacterium]|nr:hypothetical protein [Candidatus Binatia bacterium]